jgi:hypothetical protein
MQRQRGAVDRADGSSGVRVAPLSHSQRLRRLYNPYEGLNTLGGRGVAFQLPEGPEFVFQEEAAAKRRSWGENLQFYTGVGYLGGECRLRILLMYYNQHHRNCVAVAAGCCAAHPSHHSTTAAAAGGATGFAVGGYRYLHMPQDTTLSTLKLKANRLLNTSGAHGRHLAWSCCHLPAYTTVVTAPTQGWGHSPAATAALPSAWPHSTIS